MNLLVTNPTNIRYLTGFTGEGWLVWDGKKKYLLTDSRYKEEASNIPGIELIENLDAFKVLEFEEDHLTVGQYKKLSMKLVPSTGKIEAMRVKKRKDEIENIRRAGKISREAFNFIKRRIKLGVTEARIAWELESYLKVKGGDIAFPSVVAFNEHSSQPHYSGRANFPLRRDGMVLLDFGARVNGYCADMTRVVFLGKPYPAYETVVKAQQKVFELLRAGERMGATLDAAAKEVIAESGFPPYEHSLGHGIGLEVHESPRLSVKKNEMLRPGMVFSVEPGVYIPGKYGIRIEDTVVLKEKGIEILT